MVVFDCAERDGIRVVNGLNEGLRLLDVEALGVAVFDGPSLQNGQCLADGGSLVLIQRLIKGGKRK